MLGHRILYAYHISLAGEDAFIVSWYTLDDKLAS